MMTNSHNQILTQHYKLYNTVVKPLIATYEAREQKFPTPIFNESRAFTDHIARCYIDNAEDDFITKQLSRAGRHLNRMILDCYKYLIVSYDDAIKQFEERTKKIDVTIINDGDFYKKLSTLRKDAISALRKAKEFESKENGNDTQIYEKFELAFNLYCEINFLIESNLDKITWAKTKTDSRNRRWLLITISSTIISGIVSWLLSDFFNSSIFNCIN